MTENTNTPNNDKPEQPTKENIPETIYLNEHNHIPEVDVKTPVVLHDGREGFVHPSGIVCNAAGHWLIQPTGSAPLITSANAPEMQRQGVAAKRAAVIAGITDAAVELGIVKQGDSQAAIRIGAAALFRRVLTGKDRLSDSNKVFHDLMKASGWGEGKDQSVVTPVSGLPAWFSVFIEEFEPELRAITGKRMAENAKIEDK